MMLMTLSNCNVGKDYHVDKIELDDKIKRRLEILGMTKNTIVSVLNKKRSGTIIIKIRGTRFALGKSVTDGIEVRGDEE